MKKVLIFSMFLLLLTACSYSFPEKELENVYALHNENIKFDLTEKTSVGDEKATNTIVIFHDYECKQCKFFHQDIIDNKIQEDIDNGLVKLYYYDLAFLNETSQVKALLALVFEKDYPEHYGKLIKEMYNMTSEENKNFSNKDFVQNKIEELFPDLHLEESIEGIFNDDKVLLNKLQHIKELAKEQKIEKTPSVFVNGKRVKNMFYVQDIKKEYIKKGEK